VDPVAGRSAWKTAAIVAGLVGAFLVVRQVVLPALGVPT
jgi:hypothetical protein